jgi:hypothetical protein
MSKFGGVPIEPVSKFGGEPVASPSKFGGQPVSAFGGQSLTEPDLASAILSAPALNPAGPRPVFRSTDPRERPLEGLDQVTRLKPTRVETPTTAGPRNTLLQEAGSAFTQGGIELAQSAITTGRSLLGDENRTERVLPVLAPPSRDDFLGKVAQFAGGFVPTASYGPAGFGVQGYSNVLERTDNPGLAATAGLISAGLGALRIPAVVDKIPGVKQLIAQVGEKKFAKALTHTAIEGLASGTVNVGTVASEEYLSRLGGSEAQEVPYVESFLGGALGHVALSGAAHGARSVNETRRFGAIKRQAVDAKLFKPWEVEVIGDRPELFVELAKARSAGNRVTLKPRVTPDGKPVIGTDGHINVTIDIQPDAVSQREKALLGHSEPFIDAYRKHLESGGTKFEENSSDAPWLALTGSKRAGWLRDATDISDRPATQERIARAQRRAADELMVLQRGDVKFDITQRVQQTARIDAELAEKISMLVGKDNNNASGVRKRVVKAITEELPAKQQAQVLDTIDKALDSIAERFPQETQLGTFDRLLEEFQDQFDAPTRRFLEAQRDSIARGEEGYRPWGERVRQAQVELRSVLEGLANTKVEAGKREARRLADELPPGEAQKALRKSIDEVATPEQLGERMQDIARAQENYLREVTTNNLLGDVDKLGKNPQREAALKLLARLDEPRPATSPVEAASGAEGRGATAVPAPAAKPTQGGETALAGKASAPVPAVRFAGKTYTGDSHYDAMQKMLVDMTGVKPAEAAVLLAEPEASVVKNERAKELAQKLLALKDEDQGFVRDGKYLSRDEATKELGASKQVSSEDVKVAEPKPRVGQAKAGEDGAKVKPVLITHPKTGYLDIDTKALRERAAEMTSDELKVLSDEVRALVRRGQIESGLYNKALKYDLKEDAKSSVSELSRNTDRSQVKQALDTKLHAVGLLTDPVMIEAHLDQIMRGDKTSTTYKALHGDLVPKYSRHQKNQAHRDQWLDKQAQEHLGIDSKGVRGKYRLTSYFGEKLPSGITRGRAMEVYALSTDSGRKADLKKYGVEDQRTGTKYDVDKAIAELSPQDKAYVDATKKHFQTAEYNARAFRNFTLLTGRPVQLVKGWFTSRRSPQTTKPTQDFDGFASGMIKEIDPLKSREDDSRGAFKIGDYYSSFLDISDKLSLFGEMGKELYRADALVNNPKFQETYVKKYGQANYDRLKLYLANIHGNVGHASTAFDIVANQLQTGYTISRTGLNVFSAAKQYLHIMTLLADGTLRGRDVLASLATAKALSRSARKEMLEKSGLAWQRYEGGHYLKSFLVLSDQNKLPSKLNVLQHYSMVLQRTADRHVMTVAWNAAKRTAKSEGLKGPELEARTLELFEIAAGRDQPTDNPLYASELEIQARRQPLLRGALSFQREQNRIYNVVRRHVVRAAQEPTSQNLGRAGRALLFGVAGNALGIAAVNEVRRQAFAKPSDEKDVLADVVGNLTGMYYLAGPVDDLVQGILNTKRRFTSEAPSPAVAGFFDLKNAGFALSDAVNAEGEITSGPRKGQDKQTKKLQEAFDATLSAASGALGLPLWSIWTQARNLYKWTDDQTRLMTYLEHERQTLREAGKDKSARGLEIQGAYDRINEVHSQRRSGILSKESAQRRIEQELKRVVR